MPFKSTKHKQALTVTQELELTIKLEKRASVTSVCEEYGVTKQTVSQIRKLKDKKLYIFLRTVISFYLYYINIFVLSGLFHYSDRFLQHLVWKSKGRVYVLI